MAYDSELDSWELRQAELPSRGFYRNDTRTSTSYAAREFHEHQVPTNLAFNGYSQFQPRTRFSRSGTDVKIEKNSAPRSIIEANCGDSEALNGHFSALSINKGSDHYDDVDDHRQSGRNTYRCRQPSGSPTTPSTILSSRVNSRSSVRVVSCTIGKSDDVEESNVLIEQPEVQRYALNGTRVVEISASSTNLSDNGGSTNRMTRAKKKAYEEWMEKKKAADLQRKQESRRSEEEKQAEEDRIAREREERERRERENFLQWSERKRKEEASKREIIERELELERRLKEVEDKAVVAKTFYLRQWARKKEEQQKALQRKEEARKKRENEERKKRLEESEKAYVKWRETSKNRPRPATQGLLPHHKAKPSFINPNPWIMDDLGIEETTKDQSCGEVKKSISDTKSIMAKKSILTKH